MQIYNYKYKKNNYKKKLKDGPGVATKKHTNKGSSYIRMATKVKGRLYFFCAHYNGVYKT